MSPYPQNETSAAGRGSIRKPLHQGQVTAGRAAEHGDPIGADAPKTFGPSGTNPGEGVAHVVEDRRQLRLGSQPVVDRHDHVSRIDLARPAAAVSIPRRSPMISAPP